MSTLRVVPGEHISAPEPSLNGNGPADERAYFETDEKGRTTFFPNRLGEMLTQETPFAMGGGELYFHQRGTYLPDGRRAVLRRVRDELGPYWRKQRALDTLAWIEHGATDLAEAPPLDTLNLPNGLLRIDGRLLGPHSPAFLSPVQLAARYDPDATCPTVDRFLREVLADEDAVMLVYELIGLLMVPDMSFQKALMLLGPGGTGKSTLLNLISAFLGRANVSSVALHQLEENTFATACLYGMLANVFADLDARTLRSSSIFKSIVGEDAIRGERKRRDAFSWNPYSRLLFSANEAPPTMDSSSAFFDRWIVLPMTRRFRGSDTQNRGVLASITTPAELSGLLNRALDGLERLRAHGFTKVASATEAAERFALDADSTAGFVDDCCTVIPTLRVAKPTLYRAYVNWCEESGRMALSAVRFGRRMADLQPELITEGKSNGVKYWLGVGLP